jgi:hypothetical protein
MTTPEHQHPIDPLSQSIGRIEGRLDGIEKRLDRVESRLDRIDDHLRWMIGTMIAVGGLIVAILKLT